MVVDDRTKEFYLDYVGCKVFMELSGMKKVIGFISTMWDVKSCYTIKC